MIERCTTLHDYAGDKVIRCVLQKGHPGQHKVRGWEKAIGSSGLLLRTVLKKQAASR